MCAIGVVMLYEAPATALSSAQFSETAGSLTGDTLMLDLYFYSPTDTLMQMLNQAHV